MADDIVVAVAEKVLHILKSKYNNWTFEYNQHHECCTISAFHRIKSLSHVRFSFTTKGIYPSGCILSNEDMIKYDGHMLDLIYQHMDEIYTRFYRDLIPVNLL